MPSIKSTQHAKGVGFLLSMPTRFRGCLGCFCGGSLPDAFVEHLARSDRKLTLTSGMGRLPTIPLGFDCLSQLEAVNMVSLAIDLARRGITCVVVNPGWAD